MNLANELSDRYVALWNEPDPKGRRAMLADLWTDDGEHVLMAPQEAREAAAALRMQAAFEARGHRESSRCRSDRVRGLPRRPPCPRQLDPGGLRPAGRA